MVGDKEIRQAIYERLNVTELTSLLGEPKAPVHGIANSAASYPLCAYEKQSGVTVSGFLRRSLSSSPDPSLRNMIWQVQGVSVDRAGPAEDIDLAVTRLLHQRPLSVAGRSPNWGALFRVSDVRYSEAEEQTVYWHVGGLYRLGVAD